MLCHEFPNFWFCLEACEFQDLIQGFSFFISNYCLSTWGSRTKRCRFSINPSCNFHPLEVVSRYREHNFKWEKIVAYKMYWLWCKETPDRNRSLSIGIQSTNRLNCWKLFISANRRHPTIVESILRQRRRRWFDIDSTVGWCIVFLRLTHDQSTFKINNIILRIF